MCVLDLNNTWLMYRWLTLIATCCMCAVDLNDVWLQYRLPLSTSVCCVWVSCYCNMWHVCCRLKRHLTDVQTTNVDMASEVAASSGRESHHLHCIQSLSAQTAKLQADNTELTGKVCLLLLHMLLLLTTGNDQNGPKIKWPTVMLKML